MAMLLHNSPASARKPLTVSILQRTIDRVRDVTVACAFEYNDHPDGVSTPAIHIECRTGGEMGLFNSGPRRLVRAGGEVPPLVGGQMLSTAGSTAQCPGAAAPPRLPFPFPKLTVLFVNRALGVP